MIRQIQKIEIGKIMRKFVLQLIIVVVSLIVVVNVCYLFLTWLSHRVFHIENVYLQSEYRLLGTLVITLGILIFIFASIYRRRKKEVVTLADHIERVAAGDFATRIQYDEKESLAYIYRDFNQMVEELDSVQVLKNDFINNYSHEFKTPISSINGFAELLLEKELPPETQKMYLEIIRDESERLSRLTTNTLLLSKLSSQKIVSQTERYALHEQLRQCAMILSPQWLEKEQTFSGEFAEAEFEGNKELLRHVWLNLIGNAIKYTPVGGEISVELKQEGEWIAVRVSDTGMGMNDETLEHLFDPYYQGDRSRSSQGLGLGLAIAKQIVDLCHGEIRVKSCVNEGSEFAVLLPAQKG